MKNSKVRFFTQTKSVYLFLFLFLTSMGDFKRRWFPSSFNTPPQFMPTINLQYLMVMNTSLFQRKTNFGADLSRLQGKALFNCLPIKYVNVIFDYHYSNHCTKLIMIKISCPSNLNVWIWICLLWKYKLVQPFSINQQHYIALHKLYFTWHQSP